MIKKGSKHKNENEWLSVSDLMAGLMIVFLFISISLMRHAYIERDKVQQIAIIYLETKEAIYHALKEEFQQDFDKWDASVDPDTLTFTFQSPEVLFPQGKFQLTHKFKDILDDFFPRYLNILTNGYFINSKNEKVNFKDFIEEVRIEGHTSSIWNSSTTDEQAYFKNMKLSQERTRSVLNYIYYLPFSLPKKSWIKKRFSAVGLSSSHLIYKPELCNKGHFDANICHEDREKSRRVTFRIVTKSDALIKSILK